MADNSGNDTKPGAAKTGPVKPPVLDLKARPAETSSAESAPRPNPSTSKPAEPARAPAPAAGFAFGAAIAGGVLGLGAAYGLALLGLWPSAPVAPVTPADPRLAQFASAIPELETVTQTTQSELAALNQRIGALETAEPGPTPTAAAAVDLSPLESEIAALGRRVDGLNAAPADSGAIEGLRTDLAGLNTRLGELAARIGTAESGLRTLDTTMSQTTATLADQPNDIGAVLQLPLILSGFETAFGTGRPYETELGALRAADPAAKIPTAIANAAATGLTRPDVIARRFNDVLPDMLAGRPANPDAQWQDGALDWFASVIALRPTGEIEGSSPEALMSRLVGAVDRRDFADADTLINSLPAPMKAAAGDVAGLVSEQAEAARFLDGLRSQALSGGAGQ